MQGILQNFQRGGISGDFFIILSSTLSNVKATVKGFMPTGGMVDKVITQTDIIGSWSKGESIKYPKLQDIVGTERYGGGLGFANKPASQSFQRTPPGGNLQLTPRGGLRTASFRRETPGLTRRF